VATFVELTTVSQRRLDAASEPEVMPVGGYV
jgi:hypothetical protein